MTQQVIVILNYALQEIPGVPEIKPQRGYFPLTDEFINKAKRFGRA